jgi:hypothetical protein
MPGPPEGVPWANRRIRNSRVFNFEHPKWNFLGAFRMNQLGSLRECAMTKSIPGSSPNPDLDAKAMKAIVEAQNLPPGLKRTEALKKADQLCNAADIYRYVFSTELKPPE